MYTDNSPQAGYALTANVPFWEQDMSNVESVMDVNLNGLLSVTREWRHYGYMYMLLLILFADAVLKCHMMPRKPQPTGTIVNISSITGHQAPLKESFEASYHTSKVSCPTHPTEKWFQDSFADKNFRWESRGFHMFFVTSL